MKVVNTLLQEQNLTHFPSYKNVLQTSAERLYDQRKIFRNYPTAKKRILNNFQ